MDSGVRKEGFFVSLKPIHRLLISIVVAALIWIFLPSGFDITMKLSAGWIAFAISYIICCWIVIVKLPAAQIKQKAGIEDGSKPFVFTMIILSAFASLLAVVFLIISAKNNQLPEPIIIPLAFGAMFSSWCLVHTVYVFHYAQMFYKNGGLKFPGDEEPDYFDFAYFSFVLGCTFQVSDVEISAKNIRKMALFHGILICFNNSEFKV